MPLGATQFGYSFDDIGNRIYADMGMPQMRYNYTSNDLNQYTQMTVPSIIPVTGKASADARVTVTKGSSGSVVNTTRTGAFFQADIPVDNSSGKVTENLTMSAVKYDPAQDKDVVATASRSGSVDKTPKFFTYDDDGNMLTNGDWTYAWNGENRLIQATNLTNNTNLEFAYDYKGRRIYKKVYTGTTGNWTLSASKKFVYDNFVQIAEYDAMTSDTLKKSYLRDLDESLLNVNDNGTRYYYNIDGNKNVRSIIDASGNVVAEYEYSPFGKLIGRRGLYALENPFRFSSEYHDDETGLVYYNYRYYSTELGRWLSRDPILEDGGFNLYGMVDNNPVDFIDLLGLDGTSFISPDWLHGGDYDGVNKEAEEHGSCSSGAQSPLTGLENLANLPYNLLLATGALVDGVFVQFPQEMYSWGSDFNKMANGQNDLDSGVYNWALGIYSGGGDSGDVAIEAAKQISGYSYGESLNAALMYGLKTGDYSQFQIGVGQILGAALLSEALNSLPRLPNKCSLGGCFIAGTQIRIPDGMINIEDIKEGDFVLATDPELQKTEKYKVIETIIRLVPRVYELTFDGVETITVSPEHPFWIVDQGWTQVKDLKVGSFALTIEGKKIQLTGIKLIEKETTVYNITVAGIHTYHVGKIGILVHNKANRSKIFRKYGGGKKQVDAVARETGMTKVQRKEFGKYLEGRKGSMGKGGADNFTFTELLELAQEFLGK